VPKVVGVYYAGGGVEWLARANPFFHAMTIVDLVDSVLALEFVAVFLKGFVSSSELSVHFIPHSNAGWKTICQS
jgi:hypothetical protein